MERRSSVVHEASGASILVWQQKHGHVFVVVVWGDGGGVNAFEFCICFFCFLRAI